MYNREITLYEHGYVKYTGHWGDDNEPLKAARMSTGNPTGVDPEKDARLRRRLWNDKHTTPFEMCGLTIEAQVTLFERSQIQRHRTFSYNEHSGRYSEMPALYYIPDAGDILGQSASNHQMSGEPLSPAAQQVARKMIEDATAASRTAYENLLRLGVARETARMVLPLNQYTRFRMSGNLRNWAHFLALRLAPDVQPQTREMARAVAAIVADLFPETWAVMAAENDWS